MGFAFLTVDESNMASELFRIAPHEAENPTEVSLREAFVLLQNQLKPPFPLTVPSPPEYLQLNQAILFGVLVEPHLAKTHFIHLNAIVTDGYKFFVSLLLKIVTEYYPKILEPVRVQLMWVTSKLIDVSAIGVDNLLISLMRQIVGGDSTDWNLWLCMELLKALLAKWDWLLEEPFLLTSALFTYLRVLADHYRLSGSTQLVALKHMEIDFCIRVLREQFSLCLRIGRDLVRLLQDLVSIPEFRAIWKDLLLNPAEFRVPGFSNVSQLYHSRTSSRYLLLRITPEMEAQLRFLLTYVKWGSQKRYQAWFARKFLCAPERETIICDLVRFICCAHHPPNEILQSDIIPRWAIIGWLLKCSMRNHVQANAKLSLFYDWLFFDEKIDNIMNIEPAILLMVYSIPQYVDITCNLLEFLFLLMDNYDVERKDAIAQGVSAAFGILVRKGVVHSLDALTSCNALSPPLKQRLSNIFRHFKLGVSKEVLPICVPCGSLPPLNLPSLSSTERQKSVSKEQMALLCDRENGFDANIVDASVSVSDNPGASCSEVISANGHQFDVLEKLIQNLGEAIKQSKELGLQTLEEILFSFAKPSSQIPDTAVVGDSDPRLEVLACQITEAFELNGYNMFASLETNYDDEGLFATTRITRAYIFSQNKRMQRMFLFWSKNGFPVGACLLSYASRLAYEAELMGCLSNATDENNPKLSYSKMPLLKCHVNRFLTYMSVQREDSPDAIQVDCKLVAKLVEGAFAAYRHFLMSLSNTLCKEADTSLTKLLFSDLMACCQLEIKWLKFLFHCVFFRLSDLSIGDENIIRLLVDRLSDIDLVSLQFEIGLKKFSIFGEDPQRILHLVKSSLNWGFVGQQKFWGLMRSELAVSKVQLDGIVRDFFCPGVVDSNVHSIAVGGFLMLCSCSAPTPELVVAVMSLADDPFGDFSATILASWSALNAPMLFNSLAKCLETINEKNGDCLSSTLGGIRVNHSTILKFLNFLDKQGLESINHQNRVHVNIPEIKAKLSEVLAAQNNR